MRKKKEELGKEGHKKEEHKKVARKSRAHEKEMSAHDHLREAKHHMDMHDKKRGDGRHKKEEPKKEPRHKKEPAKAESHLRETHAKRNSEHGRKGHTHEEKKSGSRSAGFRSGGNDGMKIFGL